MTGSGLREGLLGAESFAEEGERRYRERVRALLERRLTPVERASHVFGLALSVGLVVFFVVQFLALRHEARPVAIAGIAVGLVFSLGWGILALVSLARGVEDFRTHGFARAYLIVFFTAALLAVMLVAGLGAADPAKGNQLILYGLAFWTVFGIPSLTVRLMRDSELRVRADVLRVELALAQLAEAAERARKA